MLHTSYYHIVILSLFQLIAAPAFSQISDAIGSASLSGLACFKVTVGDLNPELQRDGLKAEELRSDFERRLHAAEIGILTQPVWIDTLGGAELYVEVSALKYSSTQYSYWIRASVLQKVSLNRKIPRETLGATWSVSAMGVAGMSSITDKIKEQAGTLLDRFIGDYISANKPIKR